MDWRRWFPVIFSTFIFVIFSVAILMFDIGRHHDSTNLLLHLSLLLNASILIGVVLWFEDRWNYFRLIFWLVFEVITLSQIVENINKGSFWQTVLQFIVFLFVVFLLKQEITKLKSLRKSQHVDNTAIGEE